MAWENGCTDYPARAHRTGGLGDLQFTTLALVVDLGTPKMPSNWSRKAGWSGPEIRTVGWDNRKKEPVKFSLHADCPSRSCFAGGGGLVAVALAAVSSCPVSSALVGSWQFVGTGAPTP